MKRIGIVLLLGVIMAGCSPKLTSSLQSNYRPLAPEEEIVVIGPDVPEPENAELLGTVKIGDSGFTSTKKGSFEAVSALVKEQARSAGGNVVRITEHKAPDMKSSIHRIKADILRVEDVGSVVTADGPAKASEHPDYAIIYFYRNSGVGPLVNYEVHIGDTKVYRAKTKSKAEVKLYEAGKVDIWARTEAKVSIPLDVELGGEYYVRCSVSMGAFVGRPALELISAGSGKLEYESIKVKE